jgi:hypothetical protein
VHQDITTDRHNARHRARTYTQELYGSIVGVSKGQGSVIASC